MVLTRAQRARRAEEIDAAIEEFLAVRAVAVNAPPSEDPIPVVDLSDPEEEEMIANDVDEEMEALFMETDNWGEDDDEGDVNEATQGNTDEGDACARSKVNEIAQNSVGPGGGDVIKGITGVVESKVGDKEAEGTAIGMSEDPKDVAMERLDLLGVELAMLKKEIKDKLSASRRIDGSDEGGSSR